MRLDTHNTVKCRTDTKFNNIIDWAKKKKTNIYTHAHTEEQTFASVHTHTQMLYEIY